MITVREASIERQFCMAVETVGGKAFKFTSLGAAGAPDRIVLLGGKAYFVELKAPGEKLRPLQRYRQRQLTKLGFAVHVIDSPSAVGEFVKAICSEGGDLFHV